jgi:hypothetical protein
MGGGLKLRAVNNQQTVRRRRRPCPRPGHRHQSRAPNPSCNEALPSHPHPPLGGTLTPTLTPPTLSAQASSTTHSGILLMVPPSKYYSLGTSSTVPPSAASFTPSSHPVNKDAHQFRVGDPPLPPRKRLRRKHHPRRVGQRHSPRAPDSQEHLLSGQQHRPRAPNQSTRHGWD